MENTTANQNSLNAFLKFVDESTYILDGERHYISDNERVTNDELVNIFLQSDLNK